MIGGAEEIFVYTREDAKGPVINFTFAAWLAVRATEPSNEILAASAAGIFRR